MPVLLVKQRISVFEPPYGGGYTGNVCDSSLVGWKACGRPLYIIIESLTAEALIRLNRSLLKVVGLFGAKY